MSPCKISGGKIRDYWKMVLGSNTGVWFCKTIFPSGLVLNHITGQTDTTVIKRRKQKSSR